MARVSAAEKAKTHRRILEIASRIFRERGIGGASLADVMQSAGLTHGGFYRHFRSKDALVAAAFDHAVNSSIQSMADADSPTEKANAWATYLDLYLSMEHVVAWADGCPIASLATEVSRSDGMAQQAAADGLAKAVAALGNVLPDTADAGTIMSLLVGAVTLARMDRETKLAQERLHKARGLIDKLTKSEQS